MNKPKTNPWRRGSRLGPGLIDWTAKPTRNSPSGFSCSLCGKHKTESLVASFVDVQVTTLPGVGTHSSHAVCRACDERFRGRTFCAGCDKHIMPTYQDGERVSSHHPAEAWIFVFEVGGRFEVPVCGTEYGYSGETAGKLACKRKARLALSLCPAGCGGSADPGEMCDSCHSLCREGLRIREAEPLQTVTLWFPSDLCDVLRRAVTGRGASLIDAREGATRIMVNVTANQAEALQDLAKTLTAELDAAKARGFEEGNSFLTRLATGSVSMDELNKKTTGGRP